MMKSSESGSGFYQNLASRASSAAVSWFTPVVSWLGGWMSDSQPIRQRSASSQVAESLVVEIVQQGRIIQEQHEQRRQEEISASGAVDYSWLVSEKRRLYDLTDVERLELEQLCYQVAPESYSRIMREFRSALLREPSAADLPHIMRAIVCRVIDEQHSTTDAGSVSSLSRWLSQSLTSLRSRFVETPPLLADSDGMELSANVVDSMELGSLNDSDV